MARPPSRPIRAVLGPTNTGKTHLALERLTGHSSGMIGFPLRLLAREAYDKVVRVKGEREVALITGEERIVPPGARWFLATMESLPMERDCAFVGIDEAQLGADPERGHIFTDRLLHARGREETMILGSESLTPMVRALMPGAEIVGRPRFSTLRYVEPRKLSRLPPRSAVVAFSAEQVYAVAEMLRRFRGGAAVVMGALSPRTRNAQVAMFQNGEVDYLVATDAIGMGLNLDVDHIAFAALRKFDGRRQRRLTIAEMAQIAGRAGRHQRDGSFSTLAGQGSQNHFEIEEVERIENHEFPPLERLYWRDAEPPLDDLDTLIAALETPPDHPLLRLAPEAIDLAVLKGLSSLREIRETVTDRAAVGRFWALCRLPDFRQLGPEQHGRLVARLWEYLRQGRIPHGYVAERIAELDKAEGDVEQLSARLASIRTWAYVAQRDDWLDACAEIAEQARRIEEKLSDALHHRLAQRFVDRRTSVLLRGLAGQGKGDGGLFPVTVDEAHVVRVGRDPIGRLDGFAFVVDGDARLADRKLLLAAADRHMGHLLARRARELCADEDGTLEMRPGEGGKGPSIWWRGARMGRLERGRALLEPRFRPAQPLRALDAAIARPVIQHIEAVLARRIARQLAPLLRIEEAARDQRHPAALRALLAQLADNGGMLPRGGEAGDLSGFDRDMRAALRTLGISAGSLDLFVPALFKLHPHKLLEMLLALWDGARLFPAHHGGLKPVLALGNDDMPHGYRAAGRQAVRLDMAERLIRAAHDARLAQANQRGDRFAIDAGLALSMGLTEASFQALLRQAGFRRTEAGTDEQGAALALWRWRGLGRPKKRDRAEADPQNAFAKLLELDLSHG